MERVMVGIAALLFTSACQAAESFGRLYYKGSHWIIAQAGALNAPKDCFLQSKPSAINRTGADQGGGTVITIRYPEKSITLTGFKIGTLFKTVRGATLQIDQKKPHPIEPEQPFQNEEAFQSMMAGKAVRVKLAFDDGQTSVHTFPLSGFRQAYRKLADCER